MIKQNFFYWAISTLLFVFLFSEVSVAAPETLTVSRDDKGVWFIDGPEDTPLYEVFKAMGHSVATDRLWQMELYRRTATGRMAEIFGSDFVETDVFMRTLGYSVLELETAFGDMAPDVQQVIQGYVDGVNQRIIEIEGNPSLLPFEFAAMGLIPEFWTIKDILSWTAVLQRNFDPEALDTGQKDNADLLGRLSAMFGEETAFQMFEDLRWTNDPATPSSIPDHRWVFQFPPS